MDRKSTDDSTSISLREDGDLITTSPETGDIQVIYFEKRYLCIIYKYIKRLAEIYDLFCDEINWEPHFLKINMLRA